MPLTLRVALSLVAGLLTGIIAAAAFLPLYQLLTDPRKLADFCRGPSDCVDTVLMTVVYFGPLFGIAALLIVSPAVFIWLSLR